MNERVNGDRLPVRYCRPAAAVPAAREGLYEIEALEPRVLLSAAAGVVPVQPYEAYPLVRSAPRGVVVGCTLSDGSGVFLTRLEADGTPDASFGAGGVVVAPGVGWLTQMLVQPDGKLLVLAGGTWPGKADDPAYVIRFDADGRPDPTFGVGGYVQVPDGGYGGEADVAVMPDGRIVVAQAMYVPEDESVQASFYRFLPDGRLDRTYGNGGVADLHGNRGVEFVWGLRVGDAGDASAALGSWGLVGLVGGTDAAGVPDARLGEGGILEMPGVDWWDVDFQSDGSMFVTDMTDDGMRVERRGVDGEVDRSFGAGGSVELTTGGRAWGACSGPEMADGRVIWAVYRPDAGDFSLMAMNADGSTDWDFGGGAGLVTPPAPDGFYAPSIADATSDEAGRIVTATFFARAVADRPDEYALAVSRFGADGSLDRSFGSAGSVFFDAAEINGGVVERPAALLEPTPARDLPAAPAVPPVGGKDRPDDPPAAVGEGSAAADEDDADVVRAVANLSGSGDRFLALDAGALARLFGADEALFGASDDGVF